MSNQVFSNGVGGGTKYFPQVYIKDKITLIANQAAVPGVSPAYGRQSKQTNGGGNGLFFDTINGIPVPIAGGTSDLSGGQSTATKAYWQIKANGAYGGGATRLYSLVDNVISVEAVLPTAIPSTVGTVGTINTLAVAARVYNADGTVAQDYGYNGVYQPLTASAPYPLGLSTIVRVAAGQYMEIVVIGKFSSVSTGTNAIVAEIQDDLYDSTTTPGFTKVIAERCYVEFGKL